MPIKSFAATAAHLALIAAAPAEARPARPAADNWNPFATEWFSQSSRPTRAYAPASHGGLGPRPSQWCGWYMRSRHGGGPEYNIAANWRHYGSPASPQVGAIVVWDHHVGEIVGQAPNGQWIVLSGNYSGGVHQTARSIAGASVRM